MAELTAALDGGRIKRGELVAADDGRSSVEIVRARCRDFYGGRPAGLAGGVRGGVSGRGGAGEGPIGVGAGECVGVGRVLGV